MFKDTHAFSSFSVDDLEAARLFYGDTLELDVAVTEEGLTIKIADGGVVFIYPKRDHSPATFTVLNFPVDDIDAAVDGLTARGITFETYGGNIETDGKHIFRHGGDSGGPSIAWFKDPAGNFLSVLESK